MGPLNLVGLFTLDKMRRYHYLLTKKHQRSILKLQHFIPNTLQLHNQLILIHNTYCAVDAYHLR